MSDCNLNSNTKSRSNQNFKLNPNSHSKYNAQHNTYMQTPTQRHKNAHTQTHTLCVFLKITTLTSFSLRKTITLVKITAAEQQQKQKQEIQKADQKIATMLVQSCTLWYKPSFTTTFSRGLQFAWSERIDLFVDCCSKPWQNHLQNCQLRKPVNYYN